MTAINIVGIVGGEAACEPQPGDSVLVPVPDDGITTLSSKSVTTIISDLLSFQANVKIAHFTASTYAQHQIFGDLYDALGPLIDECAELLLAECKVCSTQIEVSASGVTNWVGFMITVRNTLEQVKVYQRAATSVVDQILAAITRAIYLINIEGKE